jgi:hypothetical protein
MDAGQSFKISGILVLPFFDCLAPQSKVVEVRYHFDSSLGTFGRMQGMVCQIKVHGITSKFSTNRENVIEL